MLKVKTQNYSQNPKYIPETKTKLSKFKTITQHNHLTKPNKATQTLTIKTVPTAHKQQTCLNQN